MRCAASLAALALCACMSSAPPPDRAPAEALASAWPVQLILDSSLSNASIDEAARWLGPGSWAPPLVTPSPRQLHEDALALALLSGLHDAAACALSASPQAVPAEPPELLATARLACDPPTAEPDQGAAALEPTVEATLQIGGKNQLWRLLSPGLGAAALRTRPAEGLRASSGLWSLVASRGGLPALGRRAVVRPPGEPRRVDRRR